MPKEPGRLLGDSVIAAMEAIYDLSGDEAVWTDAVVRAFEPMLDQGGGVAAFTYDVSVPGSFAGMRGSGVVVELERAKNAIRASRRR